MVKKFLATFIVFTLCAGVIAYVPVNAIAFPDSDEAVQQRDDKSGQQAKHEAMMKYRDQWKKLNQLEQEYLSYKIEALKIKDKAIDMYADAKNIEKLKQMKSAVEMKDKWKQYSEQMKQSKEKICEQRKSFYEALKNGDEKAAKDALNKWIEAKQERNKIFKKKLSLSEKMIKAKK